jgi:hypothetical protein
LFSKPYDDEIMRLLISEYFYQIARRYCALRSQIQREAQRLVDMIIADYRYDHDGSDRGLQLPQSVTLSAEITAKLYRQMDRINYSF